MSIMLNIENQTVNFRHFVLLSTKINVVYYTYRIPELHDRPYYVEADMSKFLASIIDFMNHDSSMANVYTPTEKIREFLARYNNREESYNINE